MGRVGVVGSINTDLNVFMDRLPSPGETVLGGEFLSAAGGKGANQAVAAARAGAEVVMVGAVGRDTYGTQALEQLSNDGIDTRHIGSPDAASGVALIMVDADGENLIAVAPGANHEVQAADVDAAADDLARCRAVLLQLELPPATVWHAVRTLKTAGVPVILNPAPAPREPPPQDVLAAVDVLVPNESELALLAGCGVEDEAALVEACRGLIRQGVGCVAVTLGSRGVFSVAADAERWHPGFRAQPVDTVGAGDCFCGALAAARADGAAFDEAVRFAQAAASISVTRKGAQPSMPRREEIEALLASAPGTTA